MTRVLDLSTELAGRYATRLLADCRWEVVEVRPENGAPTHQSWRAGQAADLAHLDHHLSRGKQQLTLDLTRADDVARMHELSRSFDFVVHTFPPVVADELLLSPSDSGPVIVSITPYGRTGPTSGLIGTDKTIYAHAGGTIISGDPDRAPLVADLPIASTVAGIYAAMTLIACEVGRRRGWRPARGIDVALRDLLPANLEKLVVFYTYLQSVSLRGSGVGRLETGVGAGVFRALDGDIHIFAGQQPFSAVARLIGRPEYEHDASWTDPELRTQHADEINAVVAESVAGQRVADLMARAERLGMPCSRVNELGDLAADEQVRHRDSVRIDDGHVVVSEPYRFAPPLQPGNSKTSTAADAEVSADLDAPLQGLRVLDLTHAYAGPTATRLLGELGAEVIKVESINRLDVIPRGLFPADNDTTGDWWERSGYFAERNICKKGITLDMTAERGRELFLELIRVSDVVAWNFRPRVMDNWGMSTERLMAARPGLIVLAMSGFGQTGPEASRAALAGTMEAASGLTASLRYSPPEAPSSLGFAFGDMVAGLYGGLSVLMALDRRDASQAAQPTASSAGTGGTDVAGGCYIDFACYEGPLTFLVFALQDAARRNGRIGAEGAGELTSTGRHVLIQCGPAAAERWVIVHAPDAELEGRLAADIGLDSLPTLPEAAVTDQECDAVLGKAHGLGLAAAPLLDGEAVLFDESLNDRGLFELVDRDGVGSRPHPRLFAVLADGQPIGVPLRPPPRLGQHNEEILGGLLGLDNTQLATLAAERIIGTRPKGGLPRPFSTPLDLAELERRHRARRVPEARSRWERHFGDRSHAARQAPPQQSLPGPAQEVPDQRRAPGWTDRAECDRGDAARMQAGQPHAVAASPAEPGEVLSPDGP